MKATELLLFGVAGWCAIGLTGIAASLFRGRRSEALRHAGSLALVGGIYLLVLLGVSLTQEQKVIPIGQDDCFDEMCFAVVGVGEAPGLVAGEDARVERVSIRVANHGHSAEDETRISAYLVDSRGRRSEPLPGLSGNSLNGRVAAGSQMLSQPMFQVAANASGLGLVFTHGSWQPRQLLIGDSDSIAHRRTVVALGK